ncbi:MAG: chemotaxis protein CheX [Tepidanaerobacteraceae bacterium]|jgi:CheY-specific phosphatase CheX|nr:chemotaxis protein CheX [Tepidanaerobacteraceae bacterium]
MIDKLSRCFIRAIDDIFLGFIEFIPEVQDIRENTDEINEEGTVSVVGFVGGRRGRAILYYDNELLMFFAKNMLGQEEIDEEILLETAAELNNIISGNAVTYFNDDSETKLRLIPPSVFSGRLKVVSPKITSKQIIYKTIAGKFFANIGLEGGK